MPIVAPFPAELREAILTWYAARGRTLPFRDTTDPYAILVSEAMAQQTQAARAGEAWTRFMATFPTVQALADATPADVLRAWQGLGYNRRAINLQRAARVIVDEHGGQVPERPRARSRRSPASGRIPRGPSPPWRSGCRCGAVDTNVRRVLGRIVAGDTGVLDAEGDATGRRRRGPARSAGVLDPRADGHRGDPLPAETAALRGVPRAARGAGTRAAPTAEPRARAVRETAAPFTTTSRWLRGRIVEQLRDAPNGEWVVLKGPIGDHDQAAVDVAAAALERDGVIVLGSPEDPGEPVRARLPT